MEAAPAASRLFEFVITLLSVGLPGLPPGERDPHLWHAAPPDALIAFEWSARGPGAANAVGLDGLTADAEIQRALQTLEKLLPGALPADPIAPRSVYEIPPAQVAKALLSRPGCLYIALAPPESGVPPLKRLRAAIVLHGGDQSDAVLNQLRGLVPGWMLRDTRTDPLAATQVTGLAEFRRARPYLIWGLNQGAADEAGMRVTSRQAGLAATPEFVRRVNLVAVERPSSILWVNAPAVMDLVLDLIPQAAAFKSRVPITAPGGFVLVSGLEQGRVVLRGSYPRTPSAVATITPDVLRSVPADAYFVLAGSLDLRQLESLMKSGAAGVTDDGRTALRQMRDALIAQTSHDLDPEVMAAFDTSWSVYSAPSTGGPFGIGPVCSWNLKNPQLLHSYFHDVMASWQRRLTAEPVDGWSLQAEEHLGRKVYSLHTPDSPKLGTVVSWCLTDRQLLIALQPQPLRSHLRFLDGVQPSFAERLGRDVILPAGATTWGYLDAPALTQTVWPLVPFAVGRIEPEFDMGLIPSSGALLPHLGPTTFSIQARDDQWVFECRNPLSLAAPAVAGVVLYEAIRAPSPTRVEESSAPALGLELGAPDGAAGTPPNKIAPAVATEAQPAPPARRLAPSLIRAFTPEDLQSLIPPEVFRRLEEGLTPEQQQRRKERQEKRALKKAPR
jgi:hypothetical protein